MNTIDIQNHFDDRNIPIDQVGVSDLRFPGEIGESREYS